MSVASARDASIIHPLVADAFSRFDDDGVTWCVLRGEHDLDGSVGDVDVLVARADVARARRVLEGLGFARLPAWGHGSHRFFLAYHEATDCWILLDVVTDIRFGRFQSLRVTAEQGLLTRRECRSGVAVLAPDDAFWMLLLHCLLDKGRVAAKHRRRLEQLAAAVRVDGSLPDVLRAGRASAWSAHRVVEAVRSGDWAAIDAFASRLRRELVDAPMRTRVRAAANRALRAATTVARSVGSPGPLVALLAPDGTGKSTLATALRDSFPSREVRVVYMGLYQDAKRHRAVQLPGAYLASRIGLAWGRYLVARAHSAAGRIVILDRYVYDVLLPVSTPISRSERVHRRLVGGSLPAPDLVLVLDTPGAAAFARKGEADAASLERQRAGYLELSKRLPHAHVLDASADADAVRRRAVSLVWDTCSRRLDRR